MSGRTSIALILFLATCASTVGAQFLPDINEFEVENSRLILLDTQGRRKGVLKGAVARKQRDGKIYIEDAELIIERKTEPFVLKAAEFIYEPDTNNFSCKEGLTADLPEGGKLTVPSATGEIVYTEGVLLKMAVTGDATLLTGVEGEELVNATIANPGIELKLVEPKQKPEVDKNSRFELDHFEITGSRGGELKLRLAHLPGVGPKQKQDSAVVNVSCFGDVKLSLTDAGTKADLHMLRRARMALEGQDGTFEVSSNQLDIRGNVARSKPDSAGKEGEAATEGSLRASLTDLAIDAYQNVQLKGDDFDGGASMLRYREFGDHREVRLEGDPSLTLRQEAADNEDELPRIELRSKEFIDVQIPQGIVDGSPRQIATELSQSAHVKRFVGERLEWQINGRLVRLFSVLDESTERSNVYNNSFDAYAEGYSPLLRITGLQHANERAPELQRAAVYGARSEGSFISGRAKIRVYGPDVLGVVHSDAPLSDLLKTALGLQAQRRDSDGRVIPPPARDGRLTIRASKVVDLDMLTSGDSGDITLAAEGAVALDHEPLPRDDSNLVTLSGQFVALSMKQRIIRYAQVEPETGENALATMGYDLLISKGIDVRELEGALVSQITGPGRIVVRNEESVLYFSKELDRLPKRPGEGDTPPRPDAAWLDFGLSFTARVSELEKQLEIDAPDFRLVFGEFLTPRAGRSSIKDLDELVDPEVQQLYEVQGARVFASTQRVTAKSPAVNVLLLEGNAYINSRFDRVTARAAGAIELSGSDNQSATDAPLSVVLRRDAQLELEDAGVFFGDYVRRGVFSYDGTWLLESADRLEVTFRPLEAPTEDSTLIPRVRESLAKAAQGRRAMLSRLQEIEKATELLEQATASPRPTRPGADQPWQAVEEARDAVVAMRRAMQMYVTRLPAMRVQLDVAMRSVRRCSAMLSALIDVAGSGTVQGHFKSSKPDVPKLDLSMREALFTFDGLGQIVDVAAAGPIEVSRSAYTITGSRLKRSRDGTLTLDDASISLPDDTGVQVTGITSISLKQSENKTYGTQTTRRRTMVTRVNGKNLRVAVNLGGTASGK
ncbi:MAG: hypothetical protein R3E76_07605 [Planctomycetota bacterium]